MTVYYVNYKFVDKEDDLYKESINYLFCISFKEIKKTKYELDSKPENVPIDVFFEPYYSCY